MENCRDCKLLRNATISSQGIELRVTNFLGYDEIEGIDGYYEKGKIIKITDPVQQKLAAMGGYISFYEDSIPSTKLPKSNTIWTN